jgi:hypothetical protein
LKKLDNIAIVVRSSGENTSEELVKILEKNKKENDPLIILNSIEPFSDKLYNSLVKSLELSKKFSIIIDADILVRDGFVNKVKHLTKTLPLNNSGFGIKVFDYIYNRPRYRGIHVYRTSCIESILPFYPLEKGLLRPEKYVKEKLKKEKKLEWNNNHSEYVGGVHDFYQYNKDIVYKMYIRASREKGDIKLIKEIASVNNKIEKESIYLGLDLALKGENIGNDKELFFKKNKPKINDVNYSHNKIPKYFNFVLYKNLINHYGFSRSLFKSLF